MHSQTTHPYCLNPLLTLIPQEKENSTKDQNRFITTHDSPSAQLINQINTDIISVDATKETSMKRIYSPTFQCFTILPFYAAMVRQLKILANKIDNCPSQSREFVWAQLFAIVGATHTYDGKFTTVLDDTTKQTSVNLLDIEVLFLSFFLVMKICPKILDEKEDPTVKFPLNGRRELLKKNALEFFASLRKFLPSFLGHQSNLMAVRAPSPAQFQLTHWPVGVTPNASSLLQRGSLSYLNVVQQSYMLHEWAPNLDSLPTDVKEKVWEYCKKLPEFSQLTSIPNFATIISSWSSDWQAHEDSVRELYNTIVTLHENKVLQHRYFSPQYVSERLREFMKSPAALPAGASFRPSSPGWGCPRPSSPVVLSNTTRLGSPIPTVPNPFLLSPHHITSQKPVGSKPLYQVKPSVTKTDQLSSPTPNPIIIKPISQRSGSSAFHSLGKRKHPDSENTQENINNNNDNFQTHQEHSKKSCTTDSRLDSQNVGNGNGSLRSISNNGSNLFNEIQNEKSSNTNISTNNMAISSLLT